MALDEKIYKLRRDKLKQIEALGQRAYPTKYEFTHTIPTILAEYSGKKRRAIGESAGQRARGWAHHGHPVDGESGIRASATSREEAADLREERRRR